MMRRLDAASGGSRAALSGCVRQAVNLTPLAARTQSIALFIPNLRQYSCTISVPEAESRQLVLHKR